MSRKNRPPPPPKPKPKEERPKEPPAQYRTYACWPPGTEPEEKSKWIDFHPVILWAVDIEDARRQLRRFISDAADWGIEEVRGKIA